MTIDKIEQIAPGVLNPWARNARTHSRQQIRQIADSIETSGFTNPVLIDSIGPVLAGHGRVEAAKLLGLQESPAGGSSISVPPRRGLRPRRQQARAERRLGRGPPRQGARRHPGDRGSVLRHRYHRLFGG
ncbi:MAG: ParB/Srx family N-terminal domain-containing protein [Pseudomonadota bacterium]